MNAGEHERFAPHAFDSWVGQVVPHRFRETEDGPVIVVLGRVEVTAVTVADDGRSALIRYRSVL